MAEYEDKDSTDGEPTFSTPEEELLFYARNGADINVQKLLQHCKYNNLSLNINCKGNKKCNRGWTPLHLASYFGHTNVVKILLKAGADVNLISSFGDTPLHRAAFTGREDVVGLLLEFGADVNSVNCEGHRPKDVSRNNHIIDMLKAAASQEARLSQDKLLNAAAIGDMDLLHSVLLGPSPPSILSKDQFGNTALHHAALRGHTAVVVYLLQNGMSPDVRNTKDHQWTCLTWCSDHEWTCLTWCSDHQWTCLTWCSDHEWTCLTWCSDHEWTCLSWCSDHEWTSSVDLSNFVFRSSLDLSDLVFRQ